MSRKFLTGIDVNSQRITSLADPSGNTDAANKQYVDNVARGITWKSSVKVATTTDGTLASAYANGSTIDGVSLVTGDRILIKNQTSATENGVYIVKASGTPDRATDLATGANAAGIAVTVEQGTVNGDTVFICTSDTGSAVVGTDALSFSALGGGTTFNAGNGLQLSSSTFSVKPNGTSIDVSASGVKIADAAAGDALSCSSGVLNVTPGTGLEISGDALAVDTSLVARKAIAPCAATQTTVVTHNFGTKDVMVQVYDNTGFNVVEADVSDRTTNTVTVDFGSAPTAGQYRIVVIG